MSSQKAIIEVEDFKQAVNMSADQLKNWLDTEESQEVGQKNGSNESIGHKFGKRIIELLNKSTYSADDISVVAHLKDELSKSNEQIGIGISAISCWEIAKLVEYNRLTLPCAINDWFTQTLAYPSVKLLKLAPKIAIESTQL